MLIGYVLLAIYLICTITAPVFAAGTDLSAVLMDGAQQAISFSISTAGGICLWTAVMELMEQCGINRRLGLLLRPLLKKFFPCSGRDSRILSALAQNVSANLLGLGNAATPAGIQAAQGIAAKGMAARDELCLLVVLNTASIQILPSTIAAVRAAAGAPYPFDIMPAVWVSSGISVLTALAAAALLRRFWP